MIAIPTQFFPNYIIIRKYASIVLIAIGITEVILKVFLVVRLSTDCWPNRTRHGESR